MRVKVFENSTGEKVLLVRKDVSLEEIPSERLAEIRSSLQSPYFVKETELFAYGVNVSQAIPALIAKGFCFL